uniref:Phage major capsid protein n=1 Tax=Thermocrispum agreste TaxID=37925 RepID=A0A2W4LY03_9PSEU|nr:MAG: phage major capsid protein [Thermocrispum agreste]
MNEYIRRLHEQRMRAWEAAKEILDRAVAEGRDLTADEDAAYLKANQDIDQLDQRMRELIEAENRAKEAEETYAKILAQPAREEARTDDPGAELRNWLTGRSGKRAFELRPNGPVDYRTLAKTPATAGGNTVRTSFYSQLVQHMVEVSGVLSAGPTVLRTGTGEALQIPKTTAHSASASIVAEAAQLQVNEPSFGQVTLDAYKYGFRMAISHELANDTSVDLQGYLSMQAGRALGNGFGAHLVTGTGSGQPNGVLTASTLGKTGGTGVGGAPTGDDLIDLFHSVIAPYRRSASCGWLMNDTTVAVVRKIKDNTGGAGAGNYLWQPGLTAGEPDTILGKPVYTDPNMPAVGTDAKSILFGDFSTYFVRQVETIRFERSDDFAFDSDVITYRVILRGDGDQVDTTGAVKHFAGGAS